MAWVALAVTAAAAQHQPAERLRVNADNVNLRVAPSIDSSIVRVIGKGTLVTVLARDGGWVKVQAPTATGWMRSRQAVAVTDAQLTEAMPPPQPSAPPDGEPAQAPVTPEALRGNRRGSTFGLFGGATESNAAFAGGTGSDVFSTHQGFAGGITLMAAVAGPVSLEFDPTYAQKGLLGTNGEATLAVKTAFVEVPAQFRLTIGSRRVGVFLSAGGHVAYELSCELTRSESSASMGCDADAGLAGRTKLDWGATGGGGVVLGALVVGARYDVGLRGLYTDGGQVGRNRSALIYAGVAF